MPPAVEQTMISKTLRELFLAANRVLVLTGAGVSAESGVPTFRGGGQSAVWKGLPFEVISSAAMLERDLPAVWEWFNYRGNLLAQLRTLRSVWSASNQSDAENAEPEARLQSTGTESARRTHEI